MFLTIHCLNAGPLLQRASTVKSSPIVDATASLRISLAPELPRDYSGRYLKHLQDVMPSKLSTNCCELRRCMGTVVSSGLLRVQRHYSINTWSGFQLYSRLSARGLFGPQNERDFLLARSYTVVV